MKVWLSAQCLKEDDVVLAPQQLLTEGSDSEISFTFESIYIWKVQTWHPKIPLITAIFDLLILQIQFICFTHIIHRHSQRHEWQFLPRWKHPWRWKRQRHKYCELPIQDFQRCNVTLQPIMQLDQACLELDTWTALNFIYVVLAVHLIDSIKERKLLIPRGCLCKIFWESSVVVVIKSFGVWSPPLHSQEARPAPTSVFDDFSFSIRFLCQIWCAHQEGLREEMLYYPKTRRACDEGNVALSKMTRGLLPATLTLFLSYIPWGATERGKRWNLVKNIYRCMVHLHIDSRFRRMRNCIKETTLLG